MKLLALSALFVARTLTGQGTVAGIPTEISPPARTALESLIDSAVAAGLPRDPLVSKVAEGVLKRADDARILRAVRTLALTLAQSRTLLPPGSDASTLVAGASALQAGVSPRALTRIAAAGTDETALAVALVTLADLVASRVPPDPAAASIEQLLKRGAGQRAISGFRAAVVKDISAGSVPEAALAARTRTAIRQLGPTAR